MRVRKPHFAVLLCLLLDPTRPASATMLDPNWTEQIWITLPPLPITGMAWAPDGSGRLFLPIKTGTIRIVQSGTPPVFLPTPFATVSPVFTDIECGVIGITFDPDFLHNGYVYVFVTVSPSEQQIIRYTAVGNVGSNKTILIPGLPTAGVSHNGGAVAFGPDGKLYFAIGDNGASVGVDADLVSLASKVGRANPEGGVPSDNPFVDGPGGNNDYIFARGFRNPFTMTFQPTTGKLWLNVVGTSYEQIFVVGNGDHGGWNDYENNQPAGFIPPVIRYRTNLTESRSLAAVDGAVRSGNAATFTTTSVHGIRQGEKITIADVTDPSFNGAVFVVSVPTPTTFTAAQVGPNASSGGGTTTTQPQGGAVLGGTFYDSSGAPAEYRGNFFYGDLNSGQVMRAVVGPGTTVNSVDQFATNNSSHIDTSLGPDGALYYVAYGGHVKRARYNSTVQDLIVSNMHLNMNEGRSVVFTVRLAIAPASNVTVNVARTAGSPDIVVTGGSSLTFTPSNFAVPQVVTLSSVEDGDVATDAATFTVTSAGLTLQTVEVTALDTSGASGGPAPGRVPDGATVPGVPLTVQKNPGDPDVVELDWGASCAPAATDYSVHEGDLASLYSHDSVLCTTGGATAASIVPEPGARYFLVVPMDSQREGSYGTDSAGAERPRSNIWCRSQRDFTSCP